MPRKRGEAIGVELRQVHIVQGREGQDHLAPAAAVEAPQGTRAHQDGLQESCSELSCRELPTIRASNFASTKPAEIRTISPIMA